MRVGPTMQPKMRTVMMSLICSSVDSMYSGRSEEGLMAKPRGGIKTQVAVRGIWD